MDDALKNFPGPAKYWEMQQREVCWFLKEHANLQMSSRVLDIGAGPLRIGSKLIEYLDPDCYFAMEPNAGVLARALSHTDKDLLDSKRPRFSNNADFDLSVFGCQFDIVFAHNVFIHCGTSQLLACLRSLQNVLADDGTFVCTLFLADRNYTRPDAGKYVHAEHGFINYTRDTAVAVVEDGTWKVHDIVRWGKGAMREAARSHQFVIRKVV